MPMAAGFDLNHYSDDDLVRLWHQAGNALRRRGVCRTGNIVSDVAESIVARKLALALTPNSTRGHDAVAPDGRTYQSNRAC
jgi:hypothetical protein